MSAEIPKIPKAPSKSTVMIVDDSADMRVLMRQFLELEGYQVWTARDGSEALHILSRTGERPCIIFSDLNMAGLGGESFLKELKEQGSQYENIPFYFMTGFVEAKPEGALGLLRKPVDIDQMLHVIEESCGI